MPTSGSWQRPALVLASLHAGRNSCCIRDSATAVEKRSPPLVLSPDQDLHSLPGSWGVCGPRPSGALGGVCRELAQGQGRGPGRSGTA